VGSDRDVGPETGPWGWDKVEAITVVYKPPTLFGGLLVPNVHFGAPPDIMWPLSGKPFLAYLFSGLRDMCLNDWEVFITSTDFNPFRWPTVVIKPKPHIWPETMFPDIDSVLAHVIPCLAGLYGLSVTTNEFAHLYGLFWDFDIDNSMNWLLGKAKPISLPYIEPKPIDIYVQYTLFVKENGQSKLTESKGPVRLGDFITSYESLGEIEVGKKLTVGYDAKGRRLRKRNEISFYLPLPKPPESFKELLKLGYVHLRTSYKQRPCIEAKSIVVAEAEPASNAGVKLSEEERVHFALVVLARLYRSLDDLLDALSGIYPSLRDNAGHDTPSHNIIRKSDS